MQLKLRGDSWLLGFIISLVAVNSSLSLRCLEEAVLLLFASTHFRSPRSCDRHHVTTSLSDLKCQEVQGTDFLQTDLEIRLNILTDLLFLRSHLCK